MRLRRDGQIEDGILDVNRMLQTPQYGNVPLPTDGFSARSFTIVDASDLRFSRL